MPTIAYLIYGQKQEYQQELSLSIASAMRFLREKPSDLRILLITEPEAVGSRADLPVEYLTFSAAELQEWSLNGRYLHAVKVQALKKALEVTAGPVALLDTDTRFLRHPDTLFAEIGPGRALMHVSEGPIGEHAHWGGLLAAAPETIAGYDIDGQTPMYNSGVIGLDPANIDALDDAIRLIPAMLDIEPVFSIEQFAVTCALKRHTNVGFAADSVDHFWPFHRRAFAHALVQELAPSFTPASFAALASHSLDFGPPSAPLVLRIKNRLKARLHGWSEDYRFASLAYHAALQSAKPTEAVAWSRIASHFLAKCDVTPEMILRDFSRLKGLSI